MTCNIKPTYNPDIQSMKKRGPHRVLWKISPPHDSVACRAIFNSNNLMEQYIFFCLSQCWRGFLTHFSLQHWFGSLRFLGISLCAALLGCRHRISVGLRSGHLQHLDFFFLFNNFVVELLLSFGSVSCCKAQFQSSCRCWTNGIVFDSSILWYTEEFMYMLHSWYEVLVLICCFFFDKCGTVHFSQTFPFVSLSKGPCSRTVVVCSDATLQMVTVLLCSFNREESFLW